MKDGQFARCPWASQLLKIESSYTYLSNTASISQQPVHPLNLIIRPAGVAQSVERVALISSDIPNLKVEGSSPSFGYSYTQSC
jgi:hypothetical protein